MSGRLKRHLGTGEEVIINGESFLLKPLGSEFYADFMNIAKGFRGAKNKDDMEGLFKYFDGDTMNSINRIVFNTVKKSLPDESDEDIDMFACRYMVDLFPAISRLNGLDRQGADKRFEKLAKIDELRQKHDGPSQPDKQ